MSSKTSSKTRFWGFVMLLGMMGLASACGGGGGGGGGDNNNPGAGGNDTTPPTFSGLSKVDVNNEGNIVLTSPEASDDSTSRPDMRYLIWVSTGATAERTGDPTHTFNGSETCANGECKFTVPVAVKDGNTTYRFASHAVDQNGNRDQSPHPTEAGLAISPAFAGGGGTGGGGATPTSLNVNKGHHATHPVLTVAGNNRFVIWEECPPAPQTTPDPADPAKEIGTDGWEFNHPCSITDNPALGLSKASQVHIKQGANWDLVTDASLSPARVSRDTTRHSHNPTIISNGTDTYAGWKEEGSNLFVMKFSGGNASDTLFPDGGGRPALTLHSILGGALGMAYEFSPSGPPAMPDPQLFFQQYNGTWRPTRGDTLNKTTPALGEAAVFSKKGSDLYITWKEVGKRIDVPAPTPTNPNAIRSVPVPHVFVKKRVNTDWNFVGDGSALNMNVDHEARFPSIDVLGDVPYVAWHECMDIGCGSEYIFVKHFDAAQGRWVQDSEPRTSCKIPGGNNPNCGALNHNSTFAKTPSLAIHQGKVYVAWSERDKSNNKWAVRAKKLENGVWTDVALAPANLFTNNAHQPMLVSNSQIYITWTAEENGILQVYVSPIG